MSKSVFIGIKKSYYDIVLVMDCDLQHDIKNANLMKEKMIKDNLDLVIGSRFFKTKYSGNLGFFRSLFFFSFIFIINFLLKKKLLIHFQVFLFVKKK